MKIAPNCNQTWVPPYAPPGAPCQRPCSSGDCFVPQQRPPQEHSLISRIGGGLWGGGIGGNIGATLLQTASPQAAQAATVIGFAVGATYGANAGFAKSFLTTTGAAVGGHLAAVATGDPFIALAGAAAGAFVGYKLAD